MKAMSKRQRFWLPLIVLALAGALALGGCARGVNTSGASGQNTSSQSSSTAGQSGGSSTSNDINRLQQIDQQNQNDQNGLNTDGQNANQNTGSDQEVQP